MVSPEGPTVGPEGQGADHPLTREGRPVVAFDFDGTITRRDTMLRFLTAVRSRPTVARVFLRRSPELLRARRGGTARDQAKRLVCQDILAGLASREAEAAAQRTADAVERSLIRPDTAARLRWHQREGHRVIVVSASFEAYVRPVAASLDVREVIGTRWEVDDTGVLTGRLLGQNVRGKAKADLLAGLLGADFRLEYAYGNSRGDAAMLARARYPVWVGRRPLPELGRPLGEGLGDRAGPGPWNRRPETRPPSIRG
jgi:HAD superfamily hydrolase (TIGR01490 family)